MSHEQVSRDSRKQAAMSFDPRGEAARQRGDANGRDEHGEPKREARPVERHEKSCRQDLIFARKTANHVMRRPSSGSRRCCNASVIERSLAEAN